MKVGIVSSCGGHLTEALSLYESYYSFDHFFVINDKIALPPKLENRTYFVTHSERDWRLLINFVEAFKILKHERPEVILSVGAGIVVPFAIVGRLFFDCKIIYVETIARVKHPSLTGKIMYRLANRFIYQWEPLRSYFPRGQYGGTII